MNLQDVKKGGCEEELTPNIPSWVAILKGDKKNLHVQGLKPVVVRTKIAEGYLQLAQRQEQQFRLPAVEQEARRASRASLDLTSGPRVGGLAA